MTEIRQQLLAAPIPVVSLGPLELHNLSREQVVDQIFAQLARGQGGWVITANLDHLQRCVRQPELAAIYREADILVADGKPLLWAAWLKATPLSDRVAGSDLVWLIAEAASRCGRSLFLLGGAPGAAEGARAAMLARWPQLKICGLAAPSVSSPPTSDELRHVIELLEAARPDIVYVALGSPKQEYLSRAVRERFKSAWLLGIGVSLSFIAGHVRRAPRWMQNCGLEWVHRLWQEPRRLTRRYLVDGLPFAVRLLFVSWRARGRSSPPRSPG